MVFSDSTDKKGIVEDIDFHCGTDSTSYPLDDKVRNINQWYHTVVDWILEADDSWQWDDQAHGEWPVASKNLSTGTTWDTTAGEYTLPAASTGANQNELLRVVKVNILDNSGDHSPLIAIKQSDHSYPLTELYQTNGLPRYYELAGDRVRIYPAPLAANVTTTNGLQVFFQRSIDEFTDSDTTQQPGFAPQFHRILSLGASYDYAGKQGMSNVNFLRGEIERLKKDLMTFYGFRQKDVPSRIVPKELKRRFRA